MDLTDESFDCGFWPDSLGFGDVASKGQPLGKLVTALNQLPVHFPAHEGYLFPVGRNVYDIVEFIDIVDHVVELIDALRVGYVFEGLVADHALRVGEVVAVEFAENILPPALDFKSLSQWQKRFPANA